MPIMQTATREPFNSSVIYSLAEVARMEQERQQEEELLLARAQEERERELRQAESARRLAEKARAAAEAAERRQRERETAEARAIAEARARAVIEAARIEAENKARLEAETADREHELAMLRIRSETGARRLRKALTLTLGVVFFGGGFAAYRVNNERADKARETERLRGEVLTLSEELGRVKNDDLATLDRRHAVLRSRPLIREASGAMASADEARKAIDAKSIDPARLSAFRGALDQVEERLDAVQRMAALDRRYDDLTAWASQYTRNDVVMAHAAATRAKDARSNDLGASALQPNALQPYERTLERLRNTLAHAAPAVAAPSPQARPAERRSSSSSTPSIATGAPCKQGDPLCDLRGRSL